MQRPLQEQMLPMLPPWTRRPEGPGMTRQSDTTRQVRSGCFECHGGGPHWLGRNAAGVAARHHDATGHRTWCDQAIRTVHGDASPSHPDLFATATP